MPFLWVIPLSLYLLTFIIAFDHPRWYRPIVMSIFTLCAIYLIGMVYSDDQSGILLKQTGAPGRVLQGMIKSVNWVQEKLHVDSKHRIDTNEPDISFMGYAAINFAALFGICMLCHGELVRMRPHPRHLTAFYLIDRRRRCARRPGSQFDCAAQCS